MNNAISWFEIPVTQLEKAQAFYEATLACTLRREAMGPSDGAVFPYDNDEANGGIGGALLCGPTAPAPGATGTLVLVSHDATGAAGFAHPSAFAPRH